MSWQKPVTARISDSFTDHVKRHSVNPGTDYACATGTKVEAVRAGKVIALSRTNSGAAGRWITIDHGTYQSEYLHLSEVHVKVGDLVKTGEVIAESGASGFGRNNYYGAHLHLSFRKGNQPLRNNGNLDFEAFLKKQKKASNE